MPRRKLKEKDGLILGRTPDYWEGLEEGKKHAKSSSETKALLHDLENKFNDHILAEETNQVILNKTLQELSKSFSEYRKENNDALVWVKHMKWGQKALIALLSGVAVLVGLLVALKKL